MQVNESVEAVVSSPSIPSLMWRGHGTVLPLTPAHQAGKELAASCPAMCYDSDTPGHGSMPPAAALVCMHSIHNYGKKLVNKTEINTRIGNSVWNICKKVYNHQWIEKSVNLSMISIWKRSFINRHKKIFIITCLFLSSLLLHIFNLVWHHFATTFSFITKVLHDKFASTKWKDSTLHNATAMSFKPFHSPWIMKIFVPLLVMTINKKKLVRNI